MSSYHVVLQSHNTWNNCSCNTKWFSSDITRRDCCDPRVTLVSARDSLLTGQASPFKRKLYFFSLCILSCCSNFNVSCSYLNVSFPYFSDPVSFFLFSLPLNFKLSSCKSDWVIRKRDKEDGLNISSTINWAKMFLISLVSMDLDCNKLIISNNV